ncbi:MAG: SUMF1/EgtB/PvdO family nonheme iron enzyme [Crocosphaera sp.]
MAKNWAIVIGINNYDNLRALKYAKADAEAIKQWCEIEGKFDRVFLFTEDSPDIEATPKPISTELTYATLIRFIGTQFEKPLLGTGDNLWFFFAGHGKRYQEKDYLMLPDSDPRNVEMTALSVTWITERLRRCGADNVVLFLDACRSQGSRGEGIGLEEPKGVITFYGCNPQQESYEIEELQQGAFTYALLEALRIKGTNNCATVERLYNHLRYRVPQLVQYYQKPIQRPYAIAEPATKYHLVLITQQATLKDADTLKLDAFREQTKKNYQLAEQLWIRVLAISPADRDAIDAIRELAILENGGNRESRNSGSRKQSRGSSLLTVPNFHWPQVTWPKLPQIRVSRRQVLKGMGWTGIGIGTLGLVKIVQELTSSRPKPLPTPSPQPSPTLSPPQSSSTASPSKPLLSAKTKQFEFVTVNDRGEEINRETATAQYIAEDLGNDVTLEMVEIPGGKFMMGTDDEEIERLVKKFDWDGFRRERPIHEVRVSPFFIGKYPITQAQWKAIATLNKIDIDLKPDPSSFKGDDRPVENVRWDECVEFCKRLSELTGKEYKLPSEAQWEYACRAGTTTPFHFGETITTDLANYNGNSVFASESKGQHRHETTPVGQFPPNAFGLDDTHGNVWEWCADDGYSNYEGAPTNGSAWISDDNNPTKVIRGGSWGNYPNICRCAYRYYYDLPVNSPYVGFRVVCGPPVNEVRSSSLRSGAIAQKSEV